MKRDLDLLRQLLLDIETHGDDCSVSVLRTGPNQEREEGIRYHMRLLIDAGLLKEVDKTSAGIPCVRLTNDGHEFLEISRSESRWREAKWICQERTGGLSLKIVQGLLTRRAWAAVARCPRRRRTYLTHHPRLAAENYLDEPVYRDGPYRDGSYRDEWAYRDERSYRVEPYPHDDRDFWEEEDLRAVRVRPEYRDRWRRSGIDFSGDGQIDAELASRLSGYVL